MGWRADTPAASAAADLGVQVAGSIHLVDPKNLDKTRRYGYSDVFEQLRSILRLICPCATVHTEQ